MTHEARIVPHLKGPELNTAFGLTAPRRSAVQPNSLLETAIPGIPGFLRPFSSLYDFVPFLICTCARLLVVSFAGHCFICRLY